jgi:hypothetical protein
MTKRRIDLTAHQLSEEDLRKACAGLTEKQARRLFMRVIGDYPYRRIAELEAEGGKPKSPQAIQDSVKGGLRKIRTRILLQDRVKKKRGDRERI